MKLVIVESPSKSKTITKYLGEGFIVRASIGHVRDLPKSSKKAIDIGDGFTPHYEVVAKKEDVLTDIAEQSRKVDEILLATDPDREGEAIAWHISEVLKDRIGKGVIKKMHRISFHEITKEAVQEALKNPREIDQNLRQAQEARRVLDRLVGYELSGLIWKKVRYGLSAGRVQSPALRIIVEREREIKAFIPETYWVLSGEWKTKKGDKLTLTCVEEPRHKTTIDSILDIARNNPWHIVDIEESEQKRSSKAPFITSTLQQAASSRLGFSPSRTMGIAQKLYESGHITYMRTDSTNLGAQAVAQIITVVTKNYGPQYINVRTFATKSKNAQEAHEAIRPTNFSKEAVGANDEQKKLYRLIWQRTVASQMTDAKMAKTKIVANIKNSSAVSADENDVSTAKHKETSFSSKGHGVSIPDFTATGSRILFDGWLKADPDSVGEEVTLPACAPNESLTLISIDSQEKQTQPPGRYTEAGLIKELEKRGIGRPSTYASICRTIEDRGYVEKEGRSLKPTDTGEVVSSFLEEYFPTYISDTFTAEMENELDEIANGERTYVKTLTDFYWPFHQEVLSKDKLAKATNLGAADPKFICPKCGTTPMEIKLGRNGKFLSCSKYPDCDGALTLDGTEFKKDEPIGIDPATQLPIFVLNGRFGPYVQLGVKPPKIKKAKKLKSKKDLPSDRHGKKTEKAEKALGLEDSGTPNHIPAEIAPEDPITPKPRMASIPRTMDPSKVTVADALKYLSLPRTLGIHPVSGKDVVASNGRFGLYIAHDGNYRSIKAPDDVYEISLARGLELLAIEKKPRGFKKKIDK